MNDLVKITPGGMIKTDKALVIIKDQLPAVQKILVAALQPKISQLQPIDVVNQFSAIITGAYTIAGQQPEGNTLALFIDEFYQKLMEQYPSITVDEVRTALRNGVYGEYGEYFGINPASMLKFVKAYYFSQERKEAIKNFEDKKHLLSAPVLTEDQKEQSNEDFVNILYADFLQDKLITDFIPGFIFDFLQRRQLIVLSNSEKTRIKARAVAYHTRLIAANKSEVQLMQLSRSLLLENKNPEITIRNIAKQFAVIEFFEQQKALEAAVIFNESKDL